MVVVMIGQDEDVCVYFVGFDVYRVSLDFCFFYYI